MMIKLRPGVLDQRVDECRPDLRIGLVHRASLPELGKSFFDLPALALLATGSDEILCFLGALETLTSYLLQRPQLRIHREFDRGAPKVIESFLIVTRRQCLINPSDPFALGVRAGLLLAALRQPIDFEIQPGVD